jgi:hypothetical protein
MPQYRIADGTFRLLVGLMGVGALSIVLAVGTDEALPGLMKAGIVLAGLGGIGAVPRGPAWPPRSPVRTA